MTCRVAVCLIPLLLSGCGGGGPADEPERFHVSGEVKWNGQPVGDGMIYFEPAAGNSGAPGFAVIRAGKFDTAAEGGKGHVGGKMTVRMAPGLAPDAVILDDNAPPQVTKFPVWEELQDFPKETTTRSFDIPKDAEKLLEKKRISDAA
jgi:hypothetical protein